MYSSKELENIKNSLKYWNISAEQKQCIVNLLNELESLRNENNELYHFKQTTEYVLNKETLEIIQNQMEVKEDW